MTHLTKDERAGLALLGVTTGGLWTTKQACAVLSRDRVRHLVRSETWREVWPGVLADAGLEPDRFGATRAVFLAAGPRSTVYGRSAARYWGIPLIDDLDRATGACEHLQHDAAATTSRVPRTMTDGRVLAFRQIRFEAAEVALALGPKRPDGEDAPVREPYRVARPLRTLWDLASLISHEALVCAMDHALHNKLVTRADLDGQASARAGLVGAPAYARACARADARSESPLETLGRLLLLPAIPTLVPQVRVFRYGRTVARLDLGDEAARFGVEADGMSVHGRPRAVASDRKREDGLDGEWALSRYTWWDARRDQPAFVARTVRAWARAAKRR